MIAVSTVAPDVKNFRMNGSEFLMSPMKTSVDRRKKDYEPMTDFQRWLKPRLKIGTDEEISIHDIYKRLEGSAAEVTENHIYRVVRGNPVTFKNAARPGWELAYAIGEIVGDTAGALLAAGYPVPGNPLEGTAGVIRVQIGILRGTPIYAIYPSDASEEELKEIKRVGKIVLSDEL